MEKFSLVRGVAVLISDSFRAVEDDEASGSKPFALADGLQAMYYEVMPNTVGGGGQVAGFAGLPDCLGY